MGTFLDPRKKLIIVLTALVTTLALAQEKPLFELISPGHSGVHFSQDIKDSVEENYLTYIYMYNGGGVGIGDVNNDGLPDLFFAGNQVDNRLYLNQGGFKFKDVTAQAGVAGTGHWSTGVTMVDINADGHLDIYVGSSGYPGKAPRHTNQFYINNGDGTFTDRAEEMGVAVTRHTTHATFLDYDRDGDLDLYVLNHPTVFGNDWNIQLRRFPGLDNPGSDQFFENQGDGTFVDVTAEAGLGRPGYGLSVTAGDVNNDGWLDLYVANDFFEVDALYINNQDGTFKETTLTAFDHVSHFGMGTDIADINGDGFMDIVELDMMAEDNLRKKTMMSGMNPKRFWKNVAGGNHYQYMQNTLQLNMGDGTFAEIAELSGVSTTDWSWAPLLADFDQDSRPDLVVSNGMRWEMNDNDFNRRLKKAAEENPEGSKSLFHKLLGEAPTTPITNFAYRNVDGLTFEKVTVPWGLDLPGYSYGMAYGDLDGDGDLDLVMSNMDSMATLYRNGASFHAKANWLTVELRGEGGNPLALGARVRVDAGADTHLRDMVLSRGYMSSMDPKLHFGLGSSAKVSGLWVKWPDGQIEYFGTAKVNTHRKLVKGQGQKRPWPEKKWQPLIEPVDRAGSPRFIHREKPFDDFERELLMPHKQSQHGPGLAVADVNGDDLEDFFVGGAKGQSGALFFQESGGSFRRHGKQPWTAHKEREDMGAHFFDADGDGDLDLYVSSGSNEHPAGSEAYRDRLYLNDGKGSFTDGSDRLPPVAASSGRIRSADLDGDGDEDLLVAGRQNPGNYPLPGVTRLLINEGGRFTDQAGRLAPGLEKVGMVTDLAIFDVDGDKDLDLVLAGEWMALTLFRNEGGQWKKEELVQGHDTTGWWYSLRAEDIDGDGDMDLAAGNLGLNTKYRGTQDRPFFLYANDFDDNGSWDLVLAYNNEGTVYPVRGRSCSSEQMPFIKKKFKDYHAFGNATLVDIYGDKLQQGWHRAAKEFNNGWLENKDGRFTFHAFPPSVQLGPVMAWVSTDVDGDGNKDLLGAGGLFTAEVETVRHDAHKGTILLQKKPGRFTVLPQVTHGGWASGDVKDMVLVRAADGGRLLLVAPNNGPLKMFRLVN